MHVTGHEISKLLSVKVDGRGEGLVPVQVNVTTGALQASPKKIVDVKPSPTYMAVSPCGKSVYAVTEQYDVNSSIHSLEVDAAGELVLKSSVDAKVCMVHFR